MSIAQLIRRHGGMRAIHTCPHTIFDRRTGRYRRAGWVNKIVCADGWTRALTLSDEKQLDAAPAGSLSVAACSSQAVQ